MDASHLWTRQVQEIVGERLDSLLLKLYSVYLYIYIFDSDAPHQQSTTTAPMFLKDELAELWDLLKTMKPSWQNMYTPVI